MSIMGGWQTQTGIAREGDGDLMLLGPRFGLLELMGHQL